MIYTPEMRLARNREHERKMKRRRFIRSTEFHIGAILAVACVFVMVVLPW